LGDLFHASWRGVRGDAGYVRIRGAHPLAEGIAAGKPVFCPGAHLEVEPLGDAHIAATVLRPKDRGTPRAETGHEDAGPAVVAGGHGQGRIVYFAAPLDEVYRERGFNTVRRLFHNAVRWVARAAPPVTVEGPGGVYVNLTANATRRAVHLLNYTGFISEQPARKVEWIAPLHDLRVRVRDPEAMEPVRASLLTTGKEIGFDRAGGETVFVLARLEEHECIQIEYRRG
jgi:hypothetical protein